MGMFAKMATTPGSFITAAMTGIQSGIPQLMANNDKRNQILDNIEDAKSSIAKADRAERLGLIDTSYRHIDNAVKSIMDGQRIYADYAGHKMTYEAAMYGHDVQKQVGLASAAQHAESNRLTRETREDAKLRDQVNVINGQLERIQKDNKDVYDVAYMTLPANANKQMKEMQTNAKNRIVELEKEVRANKSNIENKILEKSGNKSKVGEYNPATGKIEYN
jgi:hypothetical protein